MTRCNEAADARANHEEDWTTFELVAAYLLRRREHDGLGFLLGGGWGGFDLDKCRNPATGAIEPWAAEIVVQLDSYAEISPSSTGLKVFITGAPVQSGRRCKGFTSYDGELAGELEVYTDRRFFTVATPPESFSRPTPRLTRGP